MKKLKVFESDTKRLDEIQNELSKIMSDYPVSDPDFSKKYPSIEKYWNELIEERNSINSKIQK